MVKHITIDPTVIKWIKQIIEPLPRLTEEEAIQLVPMFRSEDLLFSMIKSLIAEYPSRLNKMLFNPNIRSKIV